MYLSITGRKTRRHDLCRIDSIVVVDLDDASRARNMLVDELEHRLQPLEPLADLPLVKVPRVQHRLLRDDAYPGGVGQERRPYSGINLDRMPEPEPRGLDVQLEPADASLVGRREPPDEVVILIVLPAA